MQADEYKCQNPRNHPRTALPTIAQVALPELDGGIEPIVFAGRDSNTGKSHSLPDRIDSLCARAINWARLRRKPKAAKKLAITVFSFPPDKGNVGTAAYLNVFGSIHRVLQVRGLSTRESLLASYSGSSSCTMLYHKQPWHWCCDLLVQQIYTVGVLVGNGDR